MIITGRGGHAGQLYVSERINNYYSNPLAMAIIILRGNNSCSCHNHTATRRAKSYAGMPCSVMLLCVLCLLHRQHYIVIVRARASNFMHTAHTDICI